LIYRQAFIKLKPLIAVKKISNSLEVIFLTDIYLYLADLIPIKRVLSSLAVGIFSFAIVLISALTNDGVRSEIIASRAFSAFAFASLTCFIILMGVEEFAIFKTNSNLNRFITSASLEDFTLDFNKDDFLNQTYYNISSDENKLT